MERKGLRVNTGKTKIMIGGTGLGLLQSSGKFPCAIGRYGVGRNSIKCYGCKHWVHKKCSAPKCEKEDLNYRCSRCQVNARPIDRRPQKDVQVGSDKLLGVHALCGWRMLTCYYDAYENHLEEVQGAAACSFILPPLLQDLWWCVQLMCPECDASCKRDLALDKTRSPSFMMQ